MAAEPRDAQPRRWGLAAAIAGVVLVAALAVLVRVGPTTTAGQRLIERALSGMKLGRVGRLSIEGLGGDPWRALTVARLTISDSRGV
ncbi:MAG: hypothetical protein ABI242_05580, partial [Caulobacteraceae bacterium]